MKNTKHNDYLLSNWYHYFVVFRELLILVFYSILTSSRKNVILLSRPVNKLIKPATICLLRHKQDHILKSHTFCTRSLNECV